MKSCRGLNQALDEDFLLARGAFPRAFQVFVAIEKEAFVEKNLSDEQVFLKALRHLPDISKLPRRPLISGNSILPIFRMGGAAARWIQRASEGLEGAGRILGRQAVNKAGVKPVPQLNGNMHQRKKLMQANETSPPAGSGAWP